MATSAEPSANAERISKQLDREISSLKEQVANLRKTIQIEASTVLSSTAGDRLIQSSASPLATTSSATATSDADSRAKLAERSAQQKAYMQQCLHRVANAVTAFKVQDPDPNAVDGGHVVGLRFEVMSRGRFLRPYYVMLNRPYHNKSLRVHRHTLPPAIPLAGLAARHLPAPRPVNDDVSSSTGCPRQDFDRFVRSLRREIARYHNRLGVSADLRRGLGLHTRNAEDVQPSDIVEVGIADIEAKQIKFIWADERSGRLVMDDDGKVVKLVVFGKQGRDWETTKELQGNYERVEDVTRKLQEYAAG